MPFLRTLGHVELIGDDDQPVNLRLKDLALVTYLAIEDSRPHSRSRLAGLLWGESSEAQARHSLTMSLVRVRSVLGKETFENSSSYVRLSGAIPSDAELLLSTTDATQRELDDDLTIYRGDFLEQFYLGPGGEDFNRWAELLRTKLNRLAVQFLDRRSQEAHHDGNWARMLRICARAIEIDPFWEDGHRRIMVALIASGEKNAAAWHYHKFAEWLKREIDSEPDPETSALVQAIKVDPTEISGEGPGRFKVPWNIPPSSVPTDLRPRLPERDVQSGGDSADFSDDNVPIHADLPAVIDELGRQPFAKCIAARIDEMFQPGSTNPGAFMVHVHGAWGAGKTSVLNFLKAELQDEERLPDKRWIVIEFNAWRNQRIRPPWWSLTREMYLQSLRQLGFTRALWLRLRWFGWRFRSDWLPPTAALLLIAAVVMIVTGAPDLGRTPSPPSMAASAPPKPSIANLAELALKLLTAFIAAGALLVGLSRSLVFGSSRAAQTYLDLSRDPLRRMITLFENLLRGIGKPVAIFVDDLDRCDGEHVVEFLEGIQTLYRGVPITYVIAADRKWICSSFETKYQGFTPTIGDPGRPLGYLFLDKLFQISVSLPQPSSQLQAEYWHYLLRASRSTSLVSIITVREHAEEMARGIIGAAYTQEELERGIAQASRGGTVLEQAARAVAAERITSTVAQRKNEHRLQDLAELLEPNPRAMKRLVNAFGFHQARHFLEGRKVVLEILARWTLLELRWPVLAEYLGVHPQHVTGILNGAAPQGVPEALVPLFTDKAVQQVVRGGKASQLPLEETVVREITGTLDHHR